MTEETDGPGELPPVPLQAPQARKLDRGQSRVGTSQEDLLEPLPLLRLVVAAVQQVGELDGGEGEAAGPLLRQVGVDPGGERVEGAGVTHPPSAQHGGVCIALSRHLR